MWGLFVGWFIQSFKAFFGGIFSWIESFHIKTAFSKIFRKILKMGKVRDLYRTGLNRGWKDEERMRGCQGERTNINSAPSVGWTTWHTSLFYLILAIREVRFHYSHLKKLVSDTATRGTCISLTKKSLTKGEIADPNTSKSQWLFPTYTPKNTKCELPPFLATPKQASGCQSTFTS